MICNFVTTFTHRFLIRILRLSRIIDALLDYLLKTGTRIRTDSLPTFTREIEFTPDIFRSLRDASE